jgi:hypothetical protein
VGRGTGWEKIGKGPYQLPIVSLSGCEFSGM